MDQVQQPSTSSPIIQVTFYKNPVVILLSIYILVIILTYMNMSESVKNTYVFGDKFRNQNGDIYWRDLYLYPYDYRKSTLSFIYGFFKSPFTWYLIGFHLLAPGFMNFNTITNTTYIRTILFSYFLLLLILAIHIILYGYIMDPELRDVESKLGDTQKIKRIKSYRNFYRVPWIFLLFLSPIYVCIFVYLMKFV